MEQHEGTAQAEIWRVLDSSVFLKWVFQDEDDADRAIVLRDEYLRGDSVIIVPSFAFLADYFRGFVLCSHSHQYFDATLLKNYYM